MSTSEQSVVSASIAPARLLPWVAAGALLLGGLGAGLVPRHASADSGTPAASFVWNVSLDGGMRSIAGVSADLPNAIQLAELGETLTPAELAQITQVLTDEAQQENASLTAVPVPTPAPTSAAAPASDDGGDSE